MALGNTLKERAVRKDMPRGGQVGKLGSTYYSTRNMSHEFELKAQVLRGNMRKAHGAAGRVVFQTRKVILQKTIYDRSQVYPSPPAPLRVLTGKLKRSESLAISGGTITLTNFAPYAKYRHEMRGTSKMYGHKLDSFWGARAMVQSAPARRKIYLAGIAATMRRQS